MNLRIISGMMIISLFICNGCNSQNNNTNAMTLKEEQQKKGKDRNPAVAGRFYDADSVRLENNLTSFFSKAKPRTSCNVVAVISPHAGYPCSGAIAASAFNQIDPEKEYDNIFIIASSHQYAYNGASIYSIGNFITPLGTVPVNIPLAELLIKENSCFNSNENAHLNDHCIEVQLPFLQYILKKKYRIVPVMLGTQDKNTCREIAIALSPYFNESNLFVVSSDFSHYPAYEDAVKADRFTADAILTGNPEKLLETLRKNDSLGFKNLSTSLCGWTSVLTLLYMISDKTEAVLTGIDYTNSGLTCGDKSQVVGYHAIAVSMKNPQEVFLLSTKDQKILTTIARTTIEKYIKEKKIPPLTPEKYSGTLSMPCGVFVTLTKDGSLRGCIGRFNPEEPLYKIVQDMAVSAATQDHRFSPVTADELGSIQIEISVLTPMRKISSIDEIVMGKHGIYIKSGYRSGTFLPQVGKETGWTKDEFLGHCAQDKAGIGWTGWKTAEIYIYEAFVFHELKE